MPRLQRYFLAAACALALSGAAFLSTGLQARDLNETRLNTQGSRTLIGEVWVDNWFELSVNGRKLVRDSVPITTERSFNAERFTFKADPPFTFAFEFRDFMQNPTGLEYIGSRRQQMGDGGAIAQFRDAETGKVIAVTNNNWRCMVAQHAPVNKSCARERDPKAGVGACAEQKTAVSNNWTSPGFDDRSWPNATRHSARAVRPKDGYDAIRWDRSAQFIWGPNLEQDNIVLCRTTVDD